MVDQPDRLDGAAGFDNPFAQGLDTERSEAGSAGYGESPFAEEYPGPASGDVTGEVPALEGPYEAFGQQSTGEAGEAFDAARLLAGPTVRRPNSGSAVKAVQDALVAIGANITADGRFGPATEAALKAFQARAGLTADGVAGPRTRAALAAAASGGAMPAPSPAPAPAPASGNRLVVDHHPMLASHRGTAPDLILKWNTIDGAGALDVVVHFHGYSGRGQAMRLDRDKEARSGLDFSDPTGTGAPGRTRPTLAILPRGNFFGGKSGAGYNFPNLVGTGAIQQLIADALARLGARRGQTYTMDRLILTGHSGGGAPVSAILVHTDPDEVEIFDGMYGSGTSVVRWASRRIARDLASPAPLPPALRVLYRPGTGTAANSEAVADGLAASLGDPGAARLRPYFRVERTSVEHNDIPGRFGWQLLANAAADLAGAATVKGRGATWQEAAGEDPEASGAWIGAPTAREQSVAEALNVDVAQPAQTYEQLDWLDIEPPERAALPEAEAEDFGDPETHLSEAPWAGEGEAFGPAADISSFDRLFEAETGVGTSLTDRLKGVAEFVLGPTLRRASKGAGVATLQRALVTLGADLAVDGDFGANTERAVRAFQSRSGLTVDGIAGPRTKTAIATALGGAAPVPVPPVPAPATAGLPEAIARIAEQEYRRWHPASSNLRETDTAAVPILQQYYREGVGDTVTAVQLQDTAWQADHPWSAVFVSWVMRTAGPGAGFPRAHAHFQYAAFGKKNRATNNTASPFWTYRVTEAAPQVGDVICLERNNSGITYDNCDDGRARAAHGDIVTEVHPGFLRVVGGNVHQNVDAKPPPTIRTLADGRLATDGAQSRYFAVVRCRGAVGGSAPAPQPAPPVPTPPVQPAGVKLSPTRFVAAYGPSARASQATHGVPALVTLGQAALESGWGAHAPRFNFFGIKARATDPEDTRQLLRTREVFSDPNHKFPEVISVTPRPDGKYDYVVRDWFRAYPDAATAFDAHGEFLVRNKRYAKAFAVANDPYAFASEVARAGYATEPTYEKELHGVMRMIEAAGGP